MMRFKTLALCVCIFGVSGSALAQPVLVKTQQNIEEYKLKNGFRVILAPNDKETKVFMNTIYFTGSLNDPMGKGGLAHLLEHLAFKGTKDVPNDEFQSRLNQHTLSHNASTGYYSTEYTNTLRPDAKSLKEMIYLEAQRMDRLVLQDQFVPTEIDIVKREREVRLDQPSSVLMDQILKASYGNQGLGRLPIGDLTELQSINLQELEKFYRDWYAPNNAVMVISGKFNKKDVLKHIDQQFSPIASRHVPEQTKVTPFDINAVKQRHFEVEKGSHHMKIHTYLHAQNEPAKTAIALSPALYTIQPSGVLYKNMVQNNTATSVSGSTWIDQNFNMVVLGAVYAPNHDASKIDQALKTELEKKPSFEATELKRLQNIVKNSQETAFKSANALGGLISNYVVSEQGNWTKYFEDQAQLQALTVDQVNAHLADFFVANNRITADITPTPEEQKKAVAQTISEQTLKATEQTKEPVQDIATYQQEVKNLVKRSKEILAKNEKKIQRGQLSNGLEYALFPTTTQNDKVLANIDVSFGSADSLFNQGQLIDLAAYLALRGSTTQTLQQIMDRSIAANGSATISPSGNGLNIRISANKEHFDDYFQYILEVLKQPSFEASEFKLIQSQVLSSLDRPYTEPDTVASLALSRIVERYPQGDLRYHAEPEWMKKQYQSATREQVVSFYQKHMGMNYAKVAITGEFDSKKIKRVLDQHLGNWNTKETYVRLPHQHYGYPAQQLHALAEQREFGSYQAVMAIPVGTDHPDVAAMQVFRHVLADSQLSSRLAQALREKNALVYSFGGNLNFNDWENSGALSIGANYTAGKAKLVSEAIHNVLIEMIENGITDQELAEAKASLLKKRVTAIEDERRIHGYLIPQLEKNRDLLFRTKRDQDLAQLTKQDVHNAIKKHIQLNHLIEVMADQYGTTEVKP